MEQTPVIVLYSHIVGLALIRSLGRRGVPVVVLHYLASEMGYKSRYVHERHKVAHPGTDEEAFIADLLKLSDRYPGALVIPTDDYTVVAASRHKTRLSEHFRVCVEDWPLVSKMISKQETYELAEAHGVPCPRSCRPSTREDLEPLRETLLFPCLVKPCEGHIFYDHFRAKMFKVDTYEELLTRFDQCREVGITVMVQEIVPGDASQNVNYNSYFANGEPVAEFTARKVRVDPPFFGSPRALVSQAIPEIIEPGRRLIRGLRYEGFSCMEFKRDERDGIYKLMEVNCRHNLTGSLAPRCGIDFAWIMYQHVSAGTLPTESVREFEKGVYWIDLAKDVMRFFVSRRAEGYTVREYLSPYLHRKIFAVLDARDPAPFVRRMVYPFEKLIFRGFNREDGPQHVIPSEAPDQREGTQPRNLDNRDHTGRDQETRDPSTPLRVPRDDSLGEQRETR